MTQIPAGWYLDPAPGQPGTQPGQRYWDGQQWTAQVYAGGPGPSYDIKTTPDGQPLAGWWVRVAAALVDGLIVGATSLLLGLPLMISYFREFTRALDDEFARIDAGASTVSPLTQMTVGLEQLVWMSVIGLAVGLTYHALFLRWRSATPGKMMMGLQVRLRERPGQLPWSAIARRLLVQNISTPFAVVPFASLVVGWFPLLDDLWPLWDSKNQALHDKVARTNVVRQRL